MVNRNLSMAEWDQFAGVGVPYRRDCPCLPVPGQRDSSQITPVFFSLTITGFRTSLRLYE